MWESFVGALLICIQFSAGLDNHHGFWASGKIIGGRNTTIEQHPYQISLFILIQQEEMFICGGSIISQEWILTAAHCVDEAVTLNVHAGSTLFSEGGITVTALQYFKHPQYNPMTADYDAAVIKLRRPLMFNTNQIGKIKLIQPGVELPEGLQTVVSGWGFTKGGMLSVVLKEVDVPIVSRKYCQQFYPNDVISRNMICAGIRTGQKDSCKGDSGGPMVANNVQVGIVSWGAPCGKTPNPGVYTNIASTGIREWIRKQTDI